MATSKEVTLTAEKKDKVAPVKKKRAPKKLNVSELFDRIILLSLQDKIYLCQWLKEQVLKDVASLQELTEQAKNL